MHDNFNGKPMTSDQDLEYEIQAKGLTAPRVTPDDLEANIIRESYFSAMEGVIAHANMNDLEPAVITQPLELLIICVLTLRNGFTVTGENACAIPENFDADLGCKIARANAISKVWPLMSYALKEQLYQRAQPLQIPTKGATP